MSAFGVAATPGAPSLRGRDPIRQPARGALYSRQHKPLGNPTPLACTVAKACVEAILGASSLDSLVRWLAPDVREQLAQQHSLARRAGRTGAPNVEVRRARVCRVSAEACEVSIVVFCEGRARAVAMRLQDVSGRWQVSAIEIG
jgi:hypothetical protein